MLVLHAVAENKHVIILLDASGSMDKNDQGEEAIQWAKDVCALSGGMGFQVSFVTFQSEMKDGDAIEVLFQQNVPDEDNMKKLEEMLDLVEYDGTFTDHRAAMDTAESILGAGQESDTVIVMLSDGELDYANSEAPDREPTEDEKKQLNVSRKNVGGWQEMDVAFILWDLAMM